MRDYFNRPDSASSLGTADTGQAWSALVGVWGIQSNQAYVPAGSALAVAGFDFGVADIDISVLLAGAPGGSNIGLTFRYTDSNNYIRLAWDSVNSANLALQKKVAGSFTTLLNPSVTHSTGKVMRIVAVGNSITTYFDGVSQGTVTESFNNTATIHGLHSNSTTAQLDNFLLSRLGRESVVV